MRVRNKHLNVPRRQRVRSELTRVDSGPYTMLRCVQDECMHV